MVRTVITVVLATMAGLAIAAVSVDGSCGGAQAITCQGSQFGNCCSQYGWCGSTALYCGEGCNPAFGTCGMVASGPTQNKTTTGTNKMQTSASPSSAMPAASAAGVKRVPRAVVVRRFL